MPGPRPSRSRDPPGFLSSNMATRHNPGPGMMTQVVEPDAPDTCFGEHLMEDSSLEVRFVKGEGGPRETEVRAGRAVPRNE